MADLTSVFYWWLLLFGIGVVFLPATTKVFARFYDRGYIFAKILGLAIISYLIWLLGSFHLLPFSASSSWLVVLLLGAANLLLARKYGKGLVEKIKDSWKIMAFEEVLFFSAFLFLAYVRAHEPSIHGLEKFMDFGFINSLLRTEFFPPKDLWLTPQTINYYYFGHLVTAILTKLSAIPPEITFNLMLATILGLTFTGAFSLGLNLFYHHTKNLKVTRYALIAGLISAFLVTLGGNLHTFYAFARGFDKYWYPDATRFIPYTIHEFPSYSWIVSDLHGHVLDIPFVLLALALLLNITISKPGKILSFTFYLLLALILSIMYMTNAWDGLIYLGLTIIVISYLQWLRVGRNKTLKIAKTRAELATPAPRDNPILQVLPNFKPSLLNHWLIDLIIGLSTSLLILGLGFFLFSLPFTFNFRPFVSGLGISQDHSPLYMLAVLWGFFYFFAVSFIIFLRKELKKIRDLSTSDILVLIFIFFSTLLLLFPEIAYIKDIYPLHYRANTMFKLGYQAFIMLSLSSVYIFMRIMVSKKNVFFLLFFCSAVVLLIPVAIYPYFGIKSYYNNLKRYQGLDGMFWLKREYPVDYQAILWLRETIAGQPVILEAVGESYTDFARISSFTGLPTVLGWPVHEWLWRGSYDEAGKRKDEVKRAYEVESLEKTREFLRKYQVEYVFVGILERQKYPQADFGKWKKLGKPVFQKKTTAIYKILP